MIKTKLFTGHFIGEYGAIDREFIDIDTEINEFLDKLELEFIDVKFSTINHGGDLWNSALLIYKEH